MIRQGQELPGSWKTARKSALVEAQKVNDRESFSVTTTRGTLHGKRGDYLVWDPKKPESKWIVEESIFGETYQEVKPNRYRKVATVDLLKMEEPFEVISLESDEKDPWKGEPGDYVARGAKGEYYGIRKAFVDANYEFLPEV